MLKNINTSNFDTCISTGHCLVDFFATWCGPCKMIMPMLEELSSNVEFQEKVNFFKVNADESPELLQRFNIRGVPTVILFNNGIEVQRINGYNPKLVYETKLVELLK